MTVLVDAEAVVLVAGESRWDEGLLAEEIEPVSAEQLGNFPQAFSHVGLIGAAMNLARAERH